MTAGSLKNPEYRTRKSHIIAVIMFLAAAICIPRGSYAAVGGSISGTLTDPTGAVVPKATIAATDTDTGVRQSVVSNDAGYYSFPNLPVGHYTLDISATGFRPYQRTNIALDVSSAVVVDAMLQVGVTQETVTVEESPVQRGNRQHAARRCDYGEQRGGSTAQRTKLHGSARSAAWV